MTKTSPDATVLSTSQPERTDDEDLVSRLEDHGLFNKAERMSMFKEARAEIVRLRAALRWRGSLIKRAAEFIRTNDPFGDYFSEHDLHLLDSEMTRIDGERE